MLVQFLWRYGLIFIALFSFNIVLASPSLSATGSISSAAANNGQPAILADQIAAQSAAQALPPTPGRATLAPSGPIMIPAAPTVSAAAYILIDATTGNVIASNNADQRRAPASLTKLMTMYVISQALASGQIHLTDQVPISKKAWKTGGSKMFIQEGHTVSVDDLIHGIIIDSGNDACVAMAEYVAGSESAFVDLMNQQAARLGMTNTHFNDVNGLPSPNHYTTAHDLSILARAIVEDYPEDYKWYSQKSFTYNKITQPNRNKLLFRDPSVDGMKTGFTDDAGYCFVASAKKNDTRLITVVLGAPSVPARFEDAESLLNYGFRFFSTHKLYTAQQKLTTIPIYKGKTNQVDVGVAQDVWITIPRGEYKNLNAVINLNQPVLAPVQKNQVLGSLQVQLNGKTLFTYPLIALQADPKGSGWSNMVDSLKLHFAKKDSSK